MKLFDVLQYPTTVNKVHESLYRSYHILERVEELLARGY